MTTDNTLHGFGLEQARNINKATGLVLGTESGGRAGAPVIQTAAVPIVVELIADLPADDFDQHDARQVVWNGNDWAFVTTVKVRKIAAEAITAGSDDDPTRLLATVVGNLGLVVTESSGEGTTTVTGGGGGTCCGCEDPEAFPGFDWGDGREPTAYQMAGVTVSCCGGGRTLEREPDEGVWTTGAIPCGEDESEMTWTLTPGGVLTATHSVEGLVARYTRNEFDTDPFCGQRFDIDESVSRGNRNCTICGDEVCLTPSRTPSNFVCMSGSQHYGNLPDRWCIRLVGSYNEAAEPCTSPLIHGQTNEYCFLTEAGTWGAQCGWGLRLNTFADDYYLLLWFESLSVWRLYLHPRGTGDELHPFSLIKEWTDDEFEPYGPNYFRETTFTTFGGNCPGSEVYTDIYLFGF